MSDDIPVENQANAEEKPYKSGFVSLVGKPNVGKSTLLNFLLGQPIAGVSTRPQTTRKRQMGILTDAQSQIIFVDSPGMHQPKDKLSQFINNEADYAIRDADVILWLVDASEKPDANDADMARRLREVQDHIPVVLLLNKVDMAKGAEARQNKATFVSLLPGVAAMEISALTGKGVAAVLDKVRELLPEGPEYYPADQITEVFERDIAGEMIRAACMELLSEEVPYGIAVRVDEYTERENGLIYIKATLFVEREAHKAIVIGKGGDMIKRIGTLARAEIEKMNASKVYLELSVKVRKDWKNDGSFLKEMGLAASG